MVENSSGAGSPFVIPEPDGCNWRLNAREARKHAVTLEEQIRGYVIHARVEHGASWAEIGEVLGVTRQAARERYGLRARD